VNDPLKIAKWVTLLSLLGGAAFDGVKGSAFRLPAPRPLASQNQSFLECRPLF